MTRAGIPAIERFVARLLVQRWCKQNPPGRTMGIVRDQQRQLVAIVAAARAAHGPDAATRRVQIKRLPGLEASSTNYSLAMVADHLARVNTAIAGTLVDLIAGQASGVDASPSRYKPDQSVTIDGALQDLDASLATLGLALADLPAIERSSVTHAHPWFGALPAATWACFPAFHTRIHLKQAELIVAGLPR